MVGRSAIFSGEHFVLEETDWYLLNLFRLWWHYGISFLRLQMWVEEVMEKFMRYGRARLQGRRSGGSEQERQGRTQLDCTLSRKKRDLLAFESPTQVRPGLGRAPSGRNVPTWCRDGPLV